MGVPWEVGKVSEQIKSGAMPTGDSEDVAGGGQLSRRQAELDRYWRIFRCSQYAGRKLDWNGRESVGPIERDVIARTGHIPPGFYDAGDALAPLEFRSPSTPVYLPRVIVNRFTSLLFSEKRHPAVGSDDDDTTDWLAGFCQATRFWAQMMRGRTYGGAMGSVGLGFKFIQGRPIVEIHDARWCTPHLADRDTGTLSRFEKLYQYSEEVKNLDGEWETRWFWYRRLITDARDIVWPKVPVENNEMPRWERESCTVVEHNFGFCPIVWVQNLDLDDSIDGDPDCLGIFEIAERIDVLWSQADRGTVANCDPSVVISSDADFESVKKGTGNALQVEKGGSAVYMEITGSGIERAMALSERLEERALMIARCVLDKGDVGPAKTATEVEHRYSSMIEQADLLREQYGERGIKPLLEMVLRAAKMLDEAKRVVDPTTGLSKIVRTEIKLPKAKVIDKETGKVIGWKARRIGSGSVVELNWPPYFTPSEAAVAAAVETAGKARQYGLLDRKHGINYIAPYFGIEDRAALLEKLDEADAAQMGPDPAELAASWSEEPEEPAVDPMAEAQRDKVELTATDLSIIVTVNEARAAHGLPPLEMDGELTVAQFKAKYRKVIKASVEATDTEGDVAEGGGRPGTAIG